MHEFNEPPSYNYDFCNHKRGTLIEINHFNSFQQVLGHQEIFAHLYETHQENQQSFAEQVEKQIEQKNDNDVSKIKDKNESRTRKKKS